ncbi:MAG: phosphate ABC transporter ATP-binding protein [Candidatus Thermoplasmatota archaeon]|nr:phosphate ABC transporter ATP-binding protein [Candidatus Thermoplasmatota archaeon]
MDILHINNIKKTLQKTTILTDLSLTVKKAEILTLVGPSGSGKTTLLRCINRLIDPDQGTIHYHENDIKNIPVVSLRKEIVLVPQETYMLPGTVYDNIAYGQNLQGYKDEAVIKQSLTDAGLDRSFLTKDAMKLSGGEKKRVSLARALAINPKILLLDEPTNGIDPKVLVTVEKNIIDFARKRNLTILWVTHNIDQATRVSDRIANLKEGTITEVQRAQEFQWGSAY